MKRSYLNESLALIDEIKEMCPSEVFLKLDALQEHVRYMVCKLYDDAVEDHEHIVSYLDWDELKKRRIALTEEEERNLKSVTPKTLFDFLKEKCVGIINTWPINKYKGEDFICGPITVHFEIQSSLSYLRDGRVNDLLPMTNDELEKIVGKNGIGGKGIYVQIYYKNVNISDNGCEDSLEYIAQSLNAIGSDEEVFINI